MLPFLRKKHQTGVIVKQREPDQKPDETMDDSAGLEACMHDLMRSLEMKDAKGAAQAFKAAFELCEAYPHEEQPMESIEES